MYYRKNPYGLYGAYPIGELFVTLIIPDERDADPERGSEFYWNDECIQKMLQPVGCNSLHFPYTLETKRGLCEMAWYYDPDAAEGDGFWDAAAVRKMREPVAHGFRIFLDPERLRRLAELV